MLMQHLDKNEPSRADRIVAVQFVVLRSIYPRPVNEDKKEDGITDIFPVHVRGNMTRYLSDARYIHKIKEQLKPADLTLVLPIFKSPRRLPPFPFAHSTTFTFPPAATGTSTKETVCPHLSCRCRIGILRPPTVALVWLPENSARQTSARDPALESADERCPICLTEILVPSTGRSATQAEPTPEFR